ncbi:hypothetical protein [Cupriavidus pinatubonensis]|uniref:Uncharacterized protein n=1 Tax=Cupriavidus pinatubonensis TaxID=248026 RepID=A0ABN7Y8J9_9BURK|nr:hypothetical protein [Cupriavidus pinatubonensis]CAG9169713.1 hypothetical protein LMG23994_01626 [Cupriavidus pinatubonensis]
MPWTLSDAAKQSELERTFQRHGIAFGAPGFYDDPNFLAREQRDPRYLELYARYVEARAYDEAYLADARRKIDVAAEVLRSEVERDGRLGACVDVSGMLGRMLDRLGVWNYVAKATLTIQFPAGSGLTPRYFWSFDVGEFAAPHAIVIAPPYYVVDVTAKLQHYDRQRAQLLPQMVLAENFKAANWRPEDLANHELLAHLQRHRISFDRFLQQQNPGMASVMEHLLPRAFTFGETRLKYVIVAVGGTIEPLEGITGYKPNGRTAQTIFDSDILPRIDH